MKLIKRNKIFGSALYTEFLLPLSMATFIICTWGTIVTIGIYIVRSNSYQVGYTLSWFLYGMFVTALLMAPDLYLFLKEH